MEPQRRPVFQKRPRQRHARPPLHVRRHQQDAAELTIDFLPPDEIRGLHTRVIDEADGGRDVHEQPRRRSARARAARRRLLVGARGGDARSDVQQLVQHARGHLPAPRRAARPTACCAQVLEREPANTQALVQSRAGARTAGPRRRGEWRCKRRLAQIEPYPPFHFFDLGLDGDAKGDFAAARDLFAREVRRADYNPEFQFWLGVANFSLGDIERRASTWPGDGAQRQRQGPRSVCGEAGLAAVVSQAVGQDHHTGADMASIYDQHLDRNPANFVALSPVELRRAQRRGVRRPRGGGPRRAPLHLARRRASARRGWPRRCARSASAAARPSARCCPTRPRWSRRTTRCRRSNAVLNTLNTRLDARAARLADEPLRERRC